MAAPDSTLASSSTANLRDQLAELEHLYDTAPVGLCYVDRELRYVRINERLAAINGAPASAHLGRTMRDVIPELADTVEPIYRRVIDTGEPELGVEIRGSTGTWLGSRSWTLAGS